jgi:DNA-binding MarR family transcriptional regulator
MVTTSPTTATPSAIGSDPPAPAAGPAGDLAERLRLAITRLARRLRQEGDIDASPTQLSALATIERRGPITLGELATAERIQPPTVTAAIDRLETHGLVRRQIDDADRRVTRVAVTADGRKLLARQRSRKTAYLARRLRAFTPDELATLDAATAILDRVLDAPDAR